MDNTEQLLLVDGSSYLYRAYHALPPMENTAGKPTGAIYGVTNMLKRLLSGDATSHVAIVFDAKGPNFRHELYPDYKANRPPMPDDLREQIDPLHQIIRAMGFPLLLVEGVEADDVIGTLANRATEKGLRTVVSTGDKDFAQLVNPHITLVNTMTGVKLDESGVEEKFSIPPSNIIDYLALIGDTVDNVPGVSKVGPKTAVKWLKEYHSLDNIVEHADEFKGKVGENLRASLDFLPLAKQLVSIRLDVELTVSLDDLVRSPMDTDKLSHLFTELEFKTWLRELDQHKKNNGHLNPTKACYLTVLDEKAFNCLLGDLQKTEAFVFDTETTSVNPMEATLVGLSFAITPHKAYYLPLGHDYEDAPSQLNREKTLLALKPLFENASLKKIGQNLKYDIAILENEGITTKGIAFDTMLESYVLNSTSSRHNLDTLADNHLNHTTIKYEDVAGKGVKQVTFNKVSIETAAPYAAEDADITLQLHQCLWPRLEKEPSLKTVFLDIEMPLIPVLASIERNGVCVDTEKLLQQSDAIAKRLGEIQTEIFSVAGEEFNLNSPQQLQEVLFTKLKLPVIKKTPLGQPSTAEAVLQELALDYPLPKFIIEHRHLSKLKSTYTDKLPLQVNPKTGRIHTSYNQAVTATGRLSSTDPNLQNIPVRSEEGRRIRQAFIAPKGYKLLAADYSQIELRIMAHLSNDATLLKAFSNGLDVHRATAAEIFGCSLDEVSKEQRRRAKAINFGLIYGMSAFGLSRQLDINRQEAQNYMDLYFARYPGVKQYMDDIRKKAHAQGYVETLFGRRLQLPALRSTNKAHQKAAERTAINAPMQGTAADIIKLAMIEMHEWLTTTNLDCKIIMQVHDELVFEIAEKDVELATQSIQQIMTEAVKLSIPLTVDIGVGQHWDEAH
jgi:DNA polymerase-1